MITWLIALTLGVLAIVAGLVPLLLDLRERRRFRTSVRLARADDVLAPPPMVEGQTLRTWLVHHHPLGGDIWPRVVAELYDRAAGVPAVFSYFHGVELPQLQRHFLAQLVILTHTGATRGAVEHVAARHAGVRNAVGVPITADIWDAVINTLVAVLREAGVPDQALTDLGATVEPFRAPILAAPFR